MTRYVIYPKGTSIEKMLLDDAYGWSTKTRARRWLKEAMEDHPEYEELQIYKLTIKKERVK